MTHDYDALAEAPVPIPCGGCGATSGRCIGCMHDFGDEESAWVRDAAALRARAATAAIGGGSLPQKKGPHNV